MIDEYEARRTPRTGFAQSMRAGLRLQARPPVQTAVPSAFASVASVISCAALVWFWPP